LARVAQQDEEQLLLHGESHDWNTTNYALHPNQLRNMTPEKLNKLMGPYLPTPPDGQQDFFPNMSEKARLLSEVAEALLDHPIYKGDVLALIESANPSASRLVYLILELFPGFRDTSIHPKTGQQHVLLQMSANSSGRFMGCNGWALPMSTNSPCLRTIESLKCCGRKVSCFIPRPWLRR
jgi:Potential Queuosine, Q, salvage protein family